MGKMKITYRVPLPEAETPAARKADLGVAAGAGPRHARPVLPALLQAGLDKGKALLRLYVHSRRVRAAARALAEALAESRDVWNWPGDRLPVGLEMSAQVEKLTRRLKLETEAHTRLEVLFKSVELGRSAAAV